MRILMLSWEYTPHVVGGLGAHVNALVPALARAGVDVTLLTPRLQGGKARELLSEISQKRKKRSRKNNG
ncbi:MAG: glycogen/starch synthase, partial [Chloroflexi bacterium]|nr:glycogen/starch synthase [Chloroflexota bacterium]